MAAAAAALKGGPPSGATVPRWLERLQASVAASRATPGAHFVQLATAGLDGRPRVRTVVFRGLLLEQGAGAAGATPAARRGDGCDGARAIKFITHVKSDKVAQARARPWCEVCWWFSASREQFRIAGRLEVVTEGPLRDEQWRAISDAAREQFFWPDPGQIVPPELVRFQDLLAPGVTIPPGGRAPAPAQTSGPVPEPSAGNAPSTAAPTAAPLAPPVLPPPDTFALLLLWPDSAQYLSLVDNYAQRDTFDAETNRWSSVRVVP
jgi:hypothetical protein